MGFLVDSVLFHACKEVVTQKAFKIQDINIEISCATTKLFKALEGVLIMENDAGSIVNSEFFSSSPRLSCLS